MSYYTKNDLTTIALLGHPNSGKTSVFNQLANTKRKTGNYAGVTVDISQANIQINNTELQLIDLPGINSLASFSNSKDEIIVGKYITDNPNNLYINIINIAQIKRHLILTLNALSNKLKLIVAINMVDTLSNKPIELTKLQQELINTLNVDVVFISARKKTGFNELKQAIAKNINNNNTKENTFSNNISENTKIVSNIVKDFKPITRSSYISKQIDKVLLNNILSIPLFFAVIYGILLITMNIHSLFSGVIDELAGLYFVSFVRKLLTVINTPEIITIIIADGIGGGIQTMLTFAPIIFTLFVLLGILEESGYSARQAFIADGVMQKIGLPGKAFVSLTLGLGCTAACSSGCRTLERESDRRLSLMISPSISCSAKLPVYIYFCFIIFTANATNMVFLMYILGILFAIVNGIFLSKSLFSNKSLPFIVELPDYRLPSFANIISNSSKKVKGFLTNLGKVIIPIIAIITLLNSVTFKGQITSNSNNTILSSISQAATPILYPLGIDKDNWEATLSLITGFLAKEVVVATLNSVYFPNPEGDGSNVSLLSDTKDIVVTFIGSVIDRNYNDFFDFSNTVIDLADNVESKRQVLMNKFNSIYGVFAFLLFFLIYTPCVAAMGAISKELGKNWAFLVGFWSVFNAFAISSLFYQWTVSIKSGLWFTAIFVIIYTAIFAIFKKLNVKYAKKWETNFVFSKKQSGI